MVSWTIVEDMTAEKWDKQLLNFSDYDFYQTYNWGQYKKYFGWTSYRFIAIDPNNKIVGMAQCLLKSFPFSIGVLWCPGGPVGDYKVINKNFRKSCYKTLGKRLLYFRIRSSNIKSVESSNYLIDSGWKQPKNKITNGLSMLLDLKQNEEKLKINLSKNWRRNLKRYKHNLLSITKWDDPDINQIYHLYSEMESYKGLEKSYSKEELISLITNFSNQIIIFCCELNGKLIGIRAAIIQHKKAWDFLAATSPVGRKYYASHQLFWTLLMECKNQGIQYYDLSGIDPKNNTGVYNFKKGTGATQIEYIGEWEWASSGLVRYFANFVIKYKMDVY